MKQCTLGFGLLLATLLLSACHNNPLKSNKEQHSTRFLINASVAAVHSINPKMDERDAQYIYLNCMNGKGAALDCGTLYQAMVHFAKNSSFLEFHNVRVADLTDKAVFESLREGYEERLFYNNLGD